MEEEGKRRVLQKGGKRSIANEIVGEVTSDEFKKQVSESLTKCS